MAYRATRWAYLVEFEPENAKKEILAAYDQENGNAVHAAARLGLSHRNLMRIVGILKLATAISKVRARAEERADASAEEVEPKTEPKTDKNKRRRDK